MDPYTVDSRFNEQMGLEKDCSLNRNLLIQKTPVKAFKFFIKTHLNL